MSAHQSDAQLQSQHLAGPLSEGVRQTEVIPPRQEDRYRDFVENAEDVILTCAPNGVITSVNRAFEKLFGYPREALIGQSYHLLSTPTSLPQWQDRLRLVSMGERVSIFWETEAQHQSGHLMYVECRTGFIYLEAAGLSRLRYG